MNFAKRLKYVSLAVQHAGKEQRVPNLTIRPETSWDGDAVGKLLASSFPTGAEAMIATRLWSDGAMALSLVGEAEGRIVAYAAFSRMTAPFRAIGLGPVATDAGARGLGHASALIREGLDQARAGGWLACFVLGNPKFYGRFGFRTGFAAGFDCAFAGPHFMAMPLQAPEMPERTGAIAYAKAFMEF